MRSPRNFRAYATMEAFNVLLVPGTALLLAPPTDRTQMVASLLAIGSCAGFLVVGATYWAALDRRLRSGDDAWQLKALKLADWLEVPLLLLTAGAAAAIIYALMVQGSTWPIIAAGILTALAALEYVNYYHRQLQHFDKWSDLKRLFSQGRLRPSHMARSLACYRRSR